MAINRHRVGTGILTTKNRQANRTYKLIRFDATGFPLVRGMQQGVRNVRNVGNRIKVCLQTNMVVNFEHRHQTASALTFYSC